MRWKEERGVFILKVLNKGSNINEVERRKGCIYIEGFE
jgi:hypothetical protein